MQFLKHSFKTLDKYIWINIDNRPTFLRFIFLKLQIIYYRVSLYDENLYFEIFFSKINGQIFVKCFDFWKLRLKKSRSFPNGYFELKYTIILNYSVGVK